MKLRIAVSIDEKGNWVAYGGSDTRGFLGCEPEDFAQEIVKGVLHWIEADIPVPERPETQVIKGKVV